MTSTILAGGTIFDGTGGPRCVGHVLVKDGKVATMSPEPITEPGARVIDVTGKWVVPGFIDNHTHYDGEVLVAPSLGESVRHGVTTVLLGGCSLSFVYADVEDACDMFTRVEAFPREILFPILSEQKRWSNPREWISHLRSLPIGPNIASFIGHSDIRANVMGIDRSVKEGEKPTQGEIDRMVGMLEESLDAGLIGISMQHNPWDKMDGRHWSKLLPAAYASGKERSALTDVVRRRGAHLQGVPDLVNRISALWYLAQSASFGVRKNLKASMVAMMDLKGDPWIRGVLSFGCAFFNRVLGADFRMQAFPVPFRVSAQGMELVIFEEFPTGALARHLSKDLKSRDATLKDPAYRAAFKKHYASRFAPKVWQKDFGDAYVTAAPDPSMIGKSFTQLAEERNQHPVDTFLDLVVEQDQAIHWETVIGNHDPSRYAPLYNDPNTVLGFADSGAHINSMAFYNMPLRVLRYVQASHEQGKPIMSLEKTVHRLTKENADFFNLDAGHLAVGKRADITVISPEKLTDEVHRHERAEFLAGLERLVNRNDEVVELVMIHGKIAWENGFTEAFGKERFGEFLKGTHEYPAARVDAAPAATPIAPDRAA